jgi:hypothetical protein
MHFESFHQLSPVNTGVPPSVGGDAPQTQVQVCDRSSMTFLTVRFDKGYAPVHSAVIACTRGPKPPAGTLAGTSARTALPHIWQTKRCR